MEKKSVFTVWHLSTPVPIIMLVSSLTELHTPQQTLSFSIVSKEQSLLGHPKEGLYNSAKQKNSVCLSDVCL